MKWAYHLFERNQSQLLAESLKDFQGWGGRSDSLNQEAGRLSRQLAFIKNEIGKLERELRMIELDTVARDNGEEKRIQNRLALFEETLRSRSRRMDIVREELRDHNPNLYSFKYGTRIVPLEKVEEYLVNDSTGILAFFWGERAVYRLVITGSERRFDKLEDIGELANCLEEMSGLKSGIPEQGKGIEAACFQTIYDALWSEKEMDLPPRMLVIPDGPLWQVPFEGLITNDHPAFDAQTKFLVERHSIFYSFSMSIQFWLEEISYRPALETGYLGIRPSFAGDPALEIRQARREALIRFRHDHGGESYLGKPAQKGRYLGQQAFAGVVHIVSHAIWDPENSLDSHIRVECPTGEDCNSDRLTLGELIETEARGRMVILEACESATGTILPGEGMKSLARGFFISGCQTVVGSGWEADQIVGEKVVDGFVGRLEADRPIDRSLQMSKRAFLAGEIEKQDYHPLRWATYKAFGSMKPLPLEKKPDLQYLWAVFGLLLLALALFQGRRRS